MIYISYSQNLLKIYNLNKMKFASWLLMFFMIFSCSKSNKQDLNEYDTRIQRGMVLMPDNSIENLDILIKNGKIVSLIPNPNLESFETSNPDIQIIDANGNFVMPGFIDAHAHLMALGKNKANLDFLQTNSWEEVVEMVEKRVAETEAGTWITGRGWHQEKWNSQPEKIVEGFPVHDQLSAISPDHPVVLTHASGHGIIANAKAMELANIHSETQIPEGGIMLLNSENKPTGIFQENAMDLILNVYQNELNNKSEEEKHQDWMNYLRLAEEEALSHGVTSLHDASIEFEDALKFKELADKNQLNLRIYAMLSDYALQNTPKEQLQKHIESTRNDKFFTNTAVKAFVDGALGSRGAWFIEDYTDLPGYKGENVTAFESLEKTARLAKELNVQVCIHAIGDRGNREVIDVFEKVLKDNIGEKRWRIEHAQHLHPDDIQRIADLDIIASMQTIHCTSDAPYVVRRIGEKRAEEGAYVWQTLLQKEVIIANGTDAPIEKINPFENIYAAVTRKDLNSNEAFYPDQKLSREKALEIYTQSNAYAAFEEDWKGKIEKNFVADIIVLDTNLLTCDLDELPNTKVLYTLVNGEIKYESKRK